MNKDFLAPRRCLMKPISVIFEAARILDSAVDAHLAGEKVRAGRLIMEADIRAIADWTEALWGGPKPDIHRVRKVDNAPPILPNEKRIEARMPSAAERRKLIERDGWNCRFCGIPVIDTLVRKAVREAYPKALRWGRKNVEQHAAFQCMWLQYDHILPHSRGGDNSLENIVITCAPCNFGRAEYTLEEVGLIDPRTLPVCSSAWDGLERFLGPK